MAAKDAGLAGRHISGGFQGRVALEKDVEEPLHTLGCVSDGHTNR